MAETNVLLQPRDGIHIFEETDNRWIFRGSELHVIEDNPTVNFVVFCTPDFIKIHHDYRDRFHEAFWSVIDNDLNGAFHCQYDYTNARVTPKVSWSCYKLKEVNGADDYKWKQPSLHITWDYQTGRQTVYIFDFLPFQEQADFLKGLPLPEARIHNPFSWHAAFAGVVLVQYDKALWMMRDVVRGHEKDRRKIPDKNSFPSLNDITRHTLHYNEVIEVAENTLHRIVQEQIRWRDEDRDTIQKHIAYWLDPHQQLLLHEKTAHALKTRSKSLNERLLNEINLRFNLVLQADSTMMKTIALVSMVYLPGTFVSGLFGTNFFDFQSTTADKWTRSTDFWLYLAVTVPLTLATIGVWAVWHWGTSIRGGRAWQRLGMGSFTGVMKGVRKSGTDLSIMELVRVATTMNRRYVRRHLTA